jgi:hypothetical protein
MAETKDEIAAERDQLKDENERLRSQLAATGTAAGRTPQAQHTFQLSEGDRQELAAHGQVNIGGVMRTREEIEGMLGPDQMDVDLGDAEPAQQGPPQQPRSEIRGVDYVYPSVRPGEIDPAVAGTPGISGPAATDSDRATDADRER